MATSNSVVTDVGGTYDSEESEQIVGNNQNEEDLDGLARKWMVDMS